MSDTAASLRRKIAGARDLRSVVGTMKAMAAASIGQYEASTRALADYSRAVELGLGACFRVKRTDAVVVERRSRNHERPIAAIVFGSDQGLVGRFNESVADRAIETLGGLHGEPQVWAVGERVHARLTQAGLPPRGLFPVPNAIKAIAPLISRLLVETEQRAGPGEDVELHLFYNRPAPGASFEASGERLLPLDENWRRRLAELPWPTKALPEVIADGATLRALVREYLFVTLFRACAQSLESENASRLAAMQRAEKHIDELLEQLVASSHRLRQSGIDEELFDVVSGFEALTTDDNGSARKGGAE